MCVNVESRKKDANSICFLEEDIKEFKFSLLLFSEKKFHVLNNNTKYKTLKQQLFD